MQSPSSQSNPSRGSPRGKGKATTDRARAKPHLEERANWTSDLTKAFLQCCANDINQYGRTSNSLDPAGWFRVNAAFNTLTNSNYTKGQLKNKWDQLKRDWAAWIMLTESPWQTGLGWDSAKNTITAPDHWWGLMINRRKEAAKFREAGLEHQDLMERVFRDVTAMGQGACIAHTWQERLADVGVEGSQEFESEGTNAVAMEDPFQTPNKRYKSGGAAGSASHGSTRKSSGTKADLSESINELLQTVRDNNEDVDKVQAMQRAEAIRRVKAMPIFVNMADPEILDLRWWALRHLEKLRKVEMFLACDTEIERHRWLYLENRHVVEEYRKGSSKEPLPPPIFPPTYD